MAQASDPLAGISFAFVPLTGVTEHMLAQQIGPPQARAQWLLSTVVSGLSRDGVPLALDDLTLAQFDALLAAYYRSLYDDLLPSEVRCSACDERFEVSFRLTEVQARMAAEAAAFEGSHDGILTAPSGRVFRLPRVSDLPDLAAGTSEDWLREKLESGPFDADALQEEIAQAGPVLSQDIAAPCPDCGVVNQIRFDLAAFLLQTLEGEAPFLWREVHLLARQYGWGLQDILSLSRHIRRQLAGLVVAEAPRVRLAS